MFFQVLWYNLDSSLKAVSGTWGRNVNLMTQKEGIQKRGKGASKPGFRQGTNTAIRSRCLGVTLLPSVLEIWSGALAQCQKPTAGVSASLHKTNSPKREKPKKDKKRNKIWFLKCRTNDSCKTDQDHHGAQLKRGHKWLNAEQHYRSAESFIVILKTAKSAMYM